MGIGFLAQIIGIFYLHVIQLLHVVMIVSVLLSMCVGGGVWGNAVPLLKTEAVPALFTFSFPSETHCHYIPKVQPT